MRYLKLALIFIYTSCALAFLIAACLYFWLPGAFNPAYWSHDRVGHALIIYAVAGVCAFAVYYLIRQGERDSRDAV